MCQRHKTDENKMIGATPLHQCSSVVNQAKIWLTSSEKTHSQGIKSCFILFESVDELINIRWKILSHTKSSELTDFPYTVALSLELLRSSARRTHRAVSDAFANTAPTVVAKLATNSVGSNTLAKWSLDKKIIWEIGVFCARQNNILIRITRFYEREVRHHVSSRWK